MKIVDLINKREKIISDSFSKRKETSEIISALQNNKWVYKIVSCYSTGGKYINIQNELNNFNEQNSFLKAYVDKMVWQDYLCKKYLLSPIDTFLQGISYYKVLETSHFF